METSIGKAKCECKRWSVTAKWPVTPLEITFFSFFGNKLFCSWSSFAISVQILRSVVFEVISLSLCHDKTSGSTRDFFWKMWGGKKKKSGIGRADLQGKIKSATCALFIHIPGIHGKHLCVSARGKCWVGGRGRGAGGDGVGNYKEWGEIQRLNAGRTEKKTLPEIQVS